MLAAASAAAALSGFLYMHRGLVAAPTLGWRAPIASFVALARSRAYILGLAIVGGAWVLHVAALSLAPISLVQTVMAGGLVLLTVIADRIFAHVVTRREWIGVGLAAAGLAVVGATMDGAGRSAHASYVSSELIAYLAIVFVLAATVAFGARGKHGGVFLGAAAGLVLGGSNIAIKALSGHSGLTSLLINPLIVVAGITLVVGTALSARSLQLGEPVPTIATTSVAGNLAAITAGPVVFADPLPHGTFGLTVRICAFALVLVATAFTPTPASTEQPG